MSWFSTKVRIACLIEGQGAVDYMDSVYVFRAKDFEEAFQCAFKLGCSQEEEYLNFENRRVSWRFKEIISLDIIRSRAINGAEVYSEPVELAPGEQIPFDAEFHPEDSKPTQAV